MQGGYIRTSITVEVRIFSLLPLTANIFSPGNLLDKRNALTSLLLFQARGTEGLSMDAEDVIALKIPHHLITLPRPT
jgi:hypothetical protein